MTASSNHRRGADHSVVTVRREAQSRSGRRGARAIAVAVSAMALSGIGVGAAYGALSSAGREAPVSAPVVEAKRQVATAPIRAAVVAPVSELSTRVSGLVDESQRIVTEKEEQRLAAERAAQEAVAKQAAAKAAKAAKEAKVAAEHATKGDGYQSDGCSWKDGNE